MLNSPVSPVQTLSSSFKLKISLTPLWPSFFQAIPPNILHIGQKRTDAADDYDTATTLIHAHHNHSYIHVQSWNLVSYPCRATNFSLNITFWHALGRAHLSSRFCTKSILHCWTLKFYKPLPPDIPLEEPPSDTPYEPSDYPSEYPSTYSSAIPSDGLPSGYPSILPETSHVTFHQRNLP